MREKRRNLLRSTAQEIIHFHPAKIGTCASARGRTVWRQYENLFLSYTKTLRSWLKTRYGFSYRTPPTTQLKTFQPKETAPNTSAVHTNCIILQTPGTLAANLAFTPIYADVKNPLNMPQRNAVECQNLRTKIARGLSQRPGASSSASRRFTMISFGCAFKAPTCGSVLRGKPTVLYSPAKLSFRDPGGLNLIVEPSDSLDICARNATSVYEMICGLFSTRNTVIKLKVRLGVNLSNKRHKCLRGEQ